MAKELTRDEKNEINAKRVRHNIERLLGNFKEGIISDFDLQRLAHAHDVNDQYKQTLPSWDYKKRESELRKRKFLLPREGVLLAEAAYDLIRDPRYSLVKQEAEKTRISIEAERNQRDNFLHETGTTCEDWGGIEGIEPYINPQ